MSVRYLTLLSTPLLSLLLASSGVAQPAPGGVPSGRLGLPQPPVSATGPIVESGARFQAASLSQPASPAGLQWQTDVQRAVWQARQQRKPLLVVFGAPWCRFCKKLEQETLAHPPLADYLNRQYVPLHVDVDQQPELAKQLGVKSLPATVLLGPDVRYWGTVGGFAEPDEYYQKVVAVHREALRQEAPPTAAR